MITLHTFASGSEGNCLLLSAPGVHFLVDAGISCRRIRSCLQELGLTLSDLSGVLVTHSHGDHTRGLQTLCKTAAVPVYASGATGAAIAAPHIAPCLRRIEPGDVFPLGAVRVTVFPTSHDAPGSVDFRFDCGGCSAGVLTDTGYVTDEAAETLRGVELLVLESNHDVLRLKSGPYPYPLQQRILGDLGHLSNAAAARFAAEMASFGTRRFILAHLSRENNTPQLALEAVTEALAPFPCEVALAPRSGVSSAYQTEGSLCRR